jgi:hypothetical protein
MFPGIRAEKPLGYGQFAAASIDASTLLSTITVGGVAGIPEGTAMVRIVPEAQAIRWRDDGTAPTTAIGQPLAVGAELIYTGNGLKNFRVIGQVANAVLNVTFYGQHTV